MLRSIVVRKYSETVSEPGFRGERHDDANQDKDKGCPAKQNVPKLAQRFVGAKNLDKYFSQAPQMRALYTLSVLIQYP